MMRFKLKKALVAMIMTSFVLGACSSPDISDDDVQDEDIQELVDLAAEYDIDIIDYDEIDDIVSDYQRELGMEDITYESGNEITFTEM